MHREIAALFVLFVATVAEGSQFALPVHVPPSLRPENGSSFEAGVGYQAIHGSGLAVDGPGGRWEFASGSKSGALTGHLHANGFLIRGNAEPLGFGRRRVTGMTGSLEGDISWNPRGGDFPLRLYTGGIANISSLSYTSARAITYSNGLIRVEPDTATSLVVGIPLGVNGAWQTSQWSYLAGAHVVAWLGGGTFFTYGPAGPFGFGRSRSVHANIGAGGNARAEYLPWRLALEAGLTTNAASGNNDDYTASWAALVFRFF